MTVSYCAVKRNKERIGKERKKNCEKTISVVVKLDI